MKKKEAGLTKNEILTQLARSPHGKLEEYLATGTQAARQEPEFFQHLIAWNQVNGQVRDSKVALPVISLTVAECRQDQELKENALAHLALLDARNLARAVHFGREVKAHDRSIKRLIQRWLRELESNWARWERVAVQHRRTLKELYVLAHLKPATMADAILFKGEKPRGTVFEVIANLKDMKPMEAAGEIMKRKIPFLIAMGALGAKAKEPELVLALIERMSPTELVTNTKMLERMGVKTVPALRAAYEEGLKRAASSKKTTLKATRAADVVDDEKLKSKLQALQEKQLKVLGGVDGNWLVLGDKSGSMTHSIEVAQQVAAILARMVKGEVHLVFFDSSPRYIEATGKTYEELQEACRRIGASGMTSVGCGVQYALDNNLTVDGIAVISDGGENTAPWFHATYQKYAEKIGKEPTVYFYQVAGDSDSFTERCKLADIDVQVFDLRKSKVDFYSLPNLVQTMSTNRYSLIDKIMAVPLLKLADVLSATEVAHA